MRIQRPLLILFATLLVFSCSDRERLNPLDPLNPVTQGRPGRPRLSSDEKTIHISWDPIENSSLTEYKVRRYSRNGGDTLIVAALPAGKTSVDDAVAYYDTTYTYTLSAITESWESLPSEPESIIPGPFNYWIADLYYRTLSKVNYDGAHFSLREHEYTPTAIHFDLSGATLWLATLYPSQIVRLSVEGEVIFSENLGGTPVDVSVDQHTGNVFVAVAGASDLICLSPDGNRIGNLPCGIVISHNTRIALDPISRNVWLAVADLQTVVRVNLESSGQFTRFSNIPSPRAISAMPDMRMVWIATDSGVLAINENDTIETYLTSYTIYDLSVNTEKKEVWVVSSDRIGKEWAIQVIEDHEGNWETRKLDTEQYMMALKIASNPGLKHPGIMVYDALEKKTIRLDSQGKMMGSLGGFSSQLDIAVESH